MPFLEGRGELIDCKMNPLNESLFVTLIKSAPGGGACKKGDPYEMALRFRASWGCELKFTAGRINGEQKVDITLGVSHQIPCPSPCFPMTETANIDTSSISVHQSRLATHYA